MIFYNHSRQPLFFPQGMKKETNNTKKQYTKTEGQVLPLKKCTVFFFYMLCDTQSKKVSSQPARLYFMM